jgi:hypothetical protein
MTDLAPFKRGTSFARTCVLPEGYTGDNFTGGVKFTLRTTIPASTVLTDADAVAQATEAAGITFEGAGTALDLCVVTIRFSAAVTKLWPLAKLVWDLKGKILGIDDEPDDVAELGSGTIQILGDVTRS